MRRLLFILGASISLFAGEIEDALSISRERVQLQSAEVQAREQWAEQKLLMESQILAAKTKLAELEQRLEIQTQARQTAERRLEDARRELQTLRKQQDAWSQTLEDAICHLEQPWKQLPLPLLEKLTEQRSVLGSARPMPERFHALFTVLGEAVQFDSQVHLVKQMVPDDAQGTLRQCDVIYLGLGTAYALSPDMKTAACGISTPDGYRWTWSEQTVAPVQEAIQILRNQKSARLVRLPLQTP